jgi:hypothetical protein
VNKKIIKALVEAGAIKKIRIVAEGSMVYVEVNTGNGYLPAKTDKGSLKTWASIDSAAKWVRLLGIGHTQLEFSKWQPTQRGMII